MHYLVKVKAAKMAAEAVTAAQSGQVDNAAKAVLESANHMAEALRNQANNKTPSGSKSTVCAVL